MRHLSLSFFGTPTVFSAGKSLKIHRRKAVVLLAYLALAQGSVRRSRLVGLFWPDVDESHGRGSLRLVLNELRTQLGSSAIKAAGDTVELNREVILECDLWNLLELLDSSDHAAAPEDPCGVLTPFLPLSFLDGINMESCPELDDWIFEVGQELESRTTGLLEKWLSVSVERMDKSRAYACAECLLQIDPAREDLHEYLISADLLRGDVQGARQRYSKLARMMARESGEGPSERISNLVASARPTPVILQEPFKLARTENRRPMLWISAAVSLFVLAVLILLFRPMLKHDLSLGVLPFRFLCNEPDLEKTAESFTSELISALVIKAPCPVTPHASVRQYRNIPMTVQEIAADLEVSHILDGSAMRDGNLIRFSVQLIDIRADTCLWAGLYEYSLEDPPDTGFNAADEISDQIVAALSGFQ